MSPSKRKKLDKIRSKLDKLDNSHYLYKILPYTDIIHTIDNTTTQTLEKLIKRDLNS